MKSSISIKNDLTDFKNLVDQMGAEFGNWKLKPIKPEKLPEDLEKELEVDINEIEITREGLFSYKGYHVLIFIKDTGHSRELLRDRPEESKKFHLTDCKTIDEMKRVKRYERYYATNSTSGEFNVDARENDQYFPVKARLKVCKNCMEKLNWANYSFAIGKEKQNIIRDKFVIESFFEKYKSMFSQLPKKYAEEHETSGYSKNQRIISHQYRKQKNWICEKCGRNLVNNKSLLHLHHISGVKSDNSISNLKALCKLCHSKQPKHNHLFLSADDMRKIQSIPESKPHSPQ